MAEAEQAKPKKRWEAIVDKSVWAVLAAVIAFVLPGLGCKKGDAPEGAPRVPRYGKK